MDKGALESLGGVDIHDPAILIGTSCPASSYLGQPRACLRNVVVVETQAHQLAPSELPSTCEAGPEVFRHSSDPLHSRTGELGGTTHS